MERSLFVEGAAVARVGVDLDPVDVTDADDARWLRACLWPDQPERVARLEAEMVLAATAPPLLLPQGDAVELVPDAFASTQSRSTNTSTTALIRNRLPYAASQISMAPTMPGEIFPAK